MSWEDYCYCSHGYFMRQAREREPLRLIATILYNANVDKKDRLTPDKIMPLITDRMSGTPENEQTKAERRAEQKRLALLGAERLNQKEREKYNGRDNKS